jgi:riboflavin biosynthesis pyrimidine reductase
VVTTPLGGPEVRRRAGAAPPPALLVDDLLKPEGLRRAHRTLYTDFGVRYLDCEGGETVLRALRAAGLLDEVFLTTTPFVVDEGAHEGVLKIFDFESEGATLIAEGRAEADAAWLFRRWRFSER